MLDSLSSLSLPEVGNLTLRLEPSTHLGRTRKKRKRRKLRAEKVVRSTVESPSEEEEVFSKRRCSEEEGSVCDEGKGLAEGVAGEWK